MSWFGTSEAGERAKNGRRSARRRAREKEAGPAIDRETVYAVNNGICCVCRLPVPHERFDVEHRTPLADGGTNEIENLGVAHPKCNSKKGDRVGPRKKGLRRTPFRRKPRAHSLPEDCF